MFIHRSGINAQKQLLSYIVIARLIFKGIAVYRVAVTFTSHQQCVSDPGFPTSSAAFGVASIIFYFGHFDMYIVIF